MADQTVPTTNDNIKNVVPSKWFKMPCAPEWVGEDLAYVTTDYVEDDYVE